MSMFTDPFVPHGDSFETLRGGRTLDLVEAARRASEAGGPTRNVLNLPVPVSQQNRGITIQGGQGAGKTIDIVRGHIAPQLREMSNPLSNAKVFLVDVKGDTTEATLALVKTLPKPPPIYLLNPFDRFSYALDPNDFATDPTRITRFVASLTFRKRDARTDEFFDNSARSHLVDLIKILHHHVPGRWTWRDLYNISTDYDLFGRVLANSPYGRQKASAIVKKQFAGIVATIQSWLDPYQAAFACMSKSPALKIDQALRGPGVFILTCPEDQFESLAPLSRTLLRHLKDRLLTDNGADPTSHTLLVLDEFAYLDHSAEVVDALFGRGRSANVSVVCAWQSWPAVCAAHGEQRMKGLLDNAAIRLWLGCGAESAKIAEMDCMRSETRRREVSTTYSPNSASSSTSYRQEMRANIIASELQCLPHPTPGDPSVHGFLCASHLPGPVRVKQHFGDFFRMMNRLPRVPAIRPRPVADMWLEPFDDIRDGNRLERLFT